MTLPEHYVEVLSLLNKLLMLQRAHVFENPAAYTDGIGPDLAQEVADTTAWLINGPRPEVVRSPTPR